MKINPNQIPTLLKGILSTLGLVHLLDNRDKEERERIRYEMERADRMSERNRRK
jgi:hypothetical protein